MFEFKHLPMEGGLLDQHPDLLERWEYIFGEQEKQRRAEEAAKKRNQPSPRRRGGSRAQY